MRFEDLDERVENGRLVHDQRSGDLVVVDERHHRDAAVGDEQLERQLVGTSPDGSSIYVSGDVVGPLQEQACVIPVLEEPCPIPLPLLTPSAQENRTVVTIAYDGDTGARSWIAHFDDPGTVWDHNWADSTGKKAFATPDGSRLYLSVGGGVDGGPRSYGLLAYDV